MSVIAEPAIILYGSVFPPKGSLLGARLPIELLTCQSMEELAHKAETFSRQYEAQYGTAPDFAFDGLCPRCSLLVPAFGIDGARQKAQELCKRLRSNFGCMVMIHGLRGDNDAVRRALEAPRISH